MNTLTLLETLEFTGIQEAGDGKYRCLCPFHKETKPSFYAYPDGTYHCFGCLAHGDLWELGDEEDLAWNVARLEISFSKNGYNPKKLRSRFCSVVNKLIAKGNLGPRIQNRVWEAFDRADLVATAKSNNLLDYDLSMRLSLHKIAKGVKHHASKKTNA